MFRKNETRARTESCRMKDDVREDKAEPLRKKAKQIKDDRGPKAERRMNSSPPPP